MTSEELEVGRLPLASARKRRAEWLRAAAPPTNAGRLALICGLIFIVAGLVKFVFHHWELQAFRDFGIPAPGVMEPIVGGLETVGGVLLVGGMMIAPTAFVLAVIMAVAFVSGGIIHDSPIPSDTLAPALLVAMIYLIYSQRTTPSNERAERT